MSHITLTLIQTLQYDTIYHEHLRYYTVTSLKKIFKKYGLHIIKVKKSLPMEDLLEFMQQKVKVTQLTKA